jgi:hypothetical protein
VHWLDSAVDEQFAWRRTGVGDLAAMPFVHGVAEVGRLAVQVLDAYLL